MTEKNPDITSVVVVTVSLRVVIFSFDRSANPFIASAALVARSAIISSGTCSHSTIISPAFTKYFLESSYRFLNHFEAIPRASTISGHQAVNNSEVAPKNSLRASLALSNASLRTFMVGSRFLTTPSMNSRMDSTILPILSSQTGVIFSSHSIPPPANCPIHSTPICNHSRIAMAQFIIASPVLPSPSDNPSALAMAAATFPNAVSIADKPRAISPTAQIRFRGINWISTVATPVRIPIPTLSIPKNRVERGFNSIPIP